jgi:hypothetical protein
VFTQNLVEELTGQRKPAIIYEDNLGTTFLVKNQQVSARTKHIDIRYHFMRDLQDKKELDVRFKRSENNSADIMTKNTPRDKDGSVTEFTSSLSRISSSVTSSPSSSNITKTTAKSKMSKQPLESKAGGHSMCTLLSDKI